MMIGVVAVLVGGGGQEEGGAQCVRGRDEVDGAPPQRLDGRGLAERGDEVRELRCVRVGGQLQPDVDGRG